MTLFIDLTAEALVVSAQASTARGTLTGHQGDTGNLSIVFLKQTGSEAAPYDVVAMPGEFDDIHVGARPAADLDEPGLLCSATEFVAVGAGDELHYEAPFNLNTDAIDDAFQAGGEKMRTLSALLDVELATADGTSRTTPIKQAPFTITRDIFRGDEGPLASGDPPYPSAALLLTTEVNSATIKRGTKAIALHDATLAVAFTTAFATAPTTVLLGPVLKTNPGDDDPPLAYAIHSITAAGFTVVLSAPAPAAASLHWLAIL